MLCRRKTVHQQDRGTIPQYGCGGLGFVIWLCLMVMSASVGARTWYVNEDGSGDAISIQAAVDSAQAGDSVVVAAGIYRESIVLDKGLALLSERGAAHTRIVPDPSATPLFAIQGSNLASHRTEIKGFWFEGFNWQGSCAIKMIASRRVEIQNNVMTGNFVGISLNGGSAFIRHNTFWKNTSYGIDASAMGSGLCEYNIVWDRAAGFGRVIAFYNDFLNLLDPGPDNPENFSLDPEFCGATAGNLNLQSDSPCAPGNSPWPASGLIGALPVGCNEVAVENHTWGVIKQLYSK
ncbi:MAG: NosD domain-containing protein [Candidatus Latescibacterota bacterium]